MTTFTTEGTVELGECPSGRDIAKSSRCKYITSPFSVFACSVSYLQQDEVEYTTVLLGAYKVVKPLYTYTCYLMTFSNVIKSTMWKTWCVHFIFHNWMAAIETNCIRILSTRSSLAMLELRKVLWRNFMKIWRTFIPVVLYFDKDGDSLPKGEKFLNRISFPARECWVAVVVIPESYFRHKWPMKELPIFLQAQRQSSELKVLPLFYKL